MSKNFSSRADMLETIKTEALADSAALSQKKRFALFSFQTPNAICDTMNDRKISKRDENGKVIVSPRNLQTTCLKSGKIKSSYFSLPSFITVGDPYVDIDRQNRLYELENKMKIPKDQPIFKPQNSFKQISGAAPYDHHTNLKDIKKLKRVNSENKVVVGPTNVLTGPYRYTIKYKHVIDEYNRELEKQRRDSADHRMKMKDKQAFYTWDVGNKNFANNKQTFQVPENLRQPRQKSNTPSNLHILAHEMAFKPSSPGKKGYNRTINPFPKYTENPIKQTVRRIPSEESMKKDPFKLNHPVVLIAPSPTVSCNFMNLRKEIATQASGVQFTQDLK